MTLELFLSSAVLSAIIAAIVSRYTSRKQLLDSLDTKSGWRRDIFLVASKTFISTDDVYLLQAALRYKPYENADSKNPKNFDDMTKLIYFDLQDILSKERGEIKKIIDKKSPFLEDFFVLIDEADAEKVRIYAKYLLKHHWEDLSKSRIGKAKYKLSKEENIISEIMSEIKKIG